MALMRLATKTAAVYVIIGGRASPMARLGKFGRLPAGRRTEPGVFNEVCAIFAHNQALLAWQRLSNLLIPSHSHSIISEPFNRLFCLAFCASHRTDTVRHTVETGRWRAIGSDRSRKTPEHVLSYSLLRSVQATASSTVTRKAFYRRR